MIVQTSSSRPFKLVNRVGVAITDHNGQRHVGFLFKIDDDGPYLLHLAWHYILRCAPEGEDDGLDESYMWADLAELEDEPRRVVASFLSTIAERKPLIPYGLNAEGIEFDRRTGEIVSRPGGRGLTCATFLLSVMKTIGYDILDVSNWPTTRPGDAEWQGRILELLEPRAPEHADAVRRDLPCARFRPEEVTGAAATAGWPHNFVQAEKAAAEVLADMERAVSKTASDTAPDIRPVRHP